MNLSSIIEDSKSVQKEAFIEVLEKAIDLIQTESGKFGNQTVKDGLVHLEPVGEGLVIGDLHGDLKSLTTILKQSGLMENLGEGKNTSVVFLGDYGDRGKSSVEVYYVVLKLKLSFPQNIILLRGNHEGPEDLMASPHDLPMQFQMRFGKDWRTAYAKIRELHASLYNMVLVRERYVMVHGGLPSKINNITDLARAHLTHPKTTFLEDMLWSDPSEYIEWVGPSPRGAGHLFGKKVTMQALEKLNVIMLIRGHEPCQEGFKTNHNGKVLTLFSMKGAPYFNQHGAFLHLPLSRKFDNAEQLLPWISKF
jgi:diadenosine tetraphosphatase ApaH/serine/threonine PP2A family protein phosphatase